MALDDIISKISRFFIRLFGSHNERVLRSMWPIVAVVGSFEPQMQRLSNDALRRKAQEYKERLAAGATLDDLLPEVFAAVREASVRTTGMRHFDVQILGGIVLHRGMIAEMATGEGKTLVATLAAALNALEGKGVHVVTVNDYLARRDVQWMGPIYDAIGLTVGAIQHDVCYMFDRNANPDPNDRLHHLRIVEKKEVYRADITYGTNNEFGFDYLRDNMKVRLEDQCQRSHHYAIVDEVDSILIDEARTPLIISGPAEEATSKYYDAARIASQLCAGSDYEVKEKEHMVLLTEQGIERAQKLAGVASFYEGANVDWPHLLEQALKAKELYKRDREYIVKDGEVVIVDEFTGRMMPGRRWSDGLHQAVEAKEHLRIQQENQTLATITLQNYFKLYTKLAGMTGTAATEAAEFEKIYGLEVVTIPTNRPLIRNTMPDLVFGSEKEKYEAIEEEVVRIHQTGRPILIGTTSIEKSELISERLKKRGIKHEVLNAKHHEREAFIIARAGQLGAVTIATNMAGRGTDIVLGPGVAARGGLHVIGTERHEARRIDNQLRGRAGRQGDPGSSQFILSLEDDLLRIFAPDWVRTILTKLGMSNGQPLESRMVSRAIEKAQKRMEEHNFDIRKNLLEYDDVMNEQRSAVYSQRQQILEGKNTKELTLEWIEDSITRAVDTFLESHSDEGLADAESLANWCAARFGISIAPTTVAGKSREEVTDVIMSRVREAYEEREAALGAETMREIEKFVLLDQIDEKWKDHLYSLEHLRSGIGLRGYAQVDPKVEYKREGFALFDNMIESIKDGVAARILRVKVSVADQERLSRRWAPTDYIKRDTTGYATAGKEPGAEVEEKPKPIVAGAKISRNAPCPCNSGKKYKKCCGRGK